MDVATASNAVEEMESMFFKVRYMVKDALRLCRGNLRNFEVDEYTLKMLKKELKYFDAAKGRWKMAR